MNDIPEIVWIAIKGTVWMLPLAILALISIFDIRGSDGPDNVGSAYVGPVLMIGFILPIMAGLAHRSRAVAFFAGGIWLLLVIAYMLLATPQASV